MMPAGIKIYNDFLYTTMVELLDYNINLFNAATHGGLILTSGKNLGNYSDTVQWSRIAGTLVAERDPWSNADVSGKSLSQTETTSVKVARRMPPVSLDPSMLKWINKDAEEAGTIVGKQLAQDMLVDQVNTALLCHNTALSNVAALIHDISAVGTGKITLEALNDAMRPMGDASERVVCWVMHSKMWFDLFGTTLANVNRLYSIDTIKIMSDPVGRPFIITDNPKLATTAEGKTTYSVLGLTAGAAKIEDNGHFVSNYDERNGKQNITRTLQAEWDYQVSVKGFAWDKTSGGKNPNAAALGASANWDRYLDSDKHLGGVILKVK